MLLAKAGMEVKRQKAARDHDDPGYQWTRRIIAIVSVLSIIALPLIGGFIDPTIPVTHSWEETKNGFLFFTNPTTVTHWGTGYGMILAPFHTHTVSAIIGMYFGGSSVK